MHTGCHARKPCHTCRAIDFAIRFYAVTNDLETSVLLALVYYPGAVGRDVRAAVMGNW